MLFLAVFVCNRGYCTEAKVHTNHYYSERLLYPDMHEYEVELAVWGMSISSVTVSGPNVAQSDLDYKETLDTQEMRWSKDFGLPGRPTVGDTYTFIVKYVNQSTETLTASVNNIEDNFPAIVTPPHGSDVISATPNFEWSGIFGNSYEFSVFVFDLEAGTMIWIQDYPADSHSVQYNSDGLAPALQDNKKYLWILESRETNYDNAAMVYSEFTYVPLGIQDNTLTTFSLQKNYPNPFNPITTIDYSIPESGMVSLVIYNTAGQKVRTLIDQELEAGLFKAIWDGRDDNGMAAASGIYFYRLTSCEFSQIEKMVLMK